MSQQPVESLRPQGRARSLQVQTSRNRLLGDPSRVAIMQALSERPRLIAGLASVTGLHRNTLRAHLRRLEEAGLVQTARRPPIGPGRPALEYRLGDLAESGDEQQLLIRALVRMVARAYDDGADELAAAEGERVGRELGTRLAYPSAAQALRQVTEVLRTLAFSPQLTVRDGTSEIALHSCPFAVSPDDPRGTIICAFHLGLIRGVVEVSAPPGPHRVRLLPHTAPQVCLTEITFG